jgi:hypothetical protein
MAAVLGCSIQIKGRVFLLPILRVRAKGGACRRRIQRRRRCQRRMRSRAIATTQFVVKQEQEQEQEQEQRGRHLTKFRVWLIMRV